jgi:hypothetical protein
MIWTLLLFSFVHAQEKSGLQQMLEKDAAVQTQERWTTVGGTRYREVVYQGKKYYLKFNERRGDFSELDCLNPAQQNPPGVEAELTVVHRSRVFVSFLQEKCGPDAHGQARASYTIDPRIGFTIPDEPNSAIKDKKIFLSPFNGLGFSGTW